MALGTEILLLVILLIFSGFFSGSEVALVSLSRSKAEQLYKKKNFGAVYVKKLKDDPQRMLATILIGNNIANVAASAIATSIMIGIFQNYAVGIATGVMTLLILIFGEITHCEKNILSQRPRGKEFNYYGNYSGIPGLAFGG